MHAGILFERGALAMDAWVERDGREGPLQRLSTRGWLPIGKPPALSTS
jgi:hypothetical protein